MKILILTVLFAGVISVIFAVLRSGHIFKSLFSTVFQGVASLFAVNVIGLLTGVTIAVNYFTLIFVSVFGTPGCIVLLLADTLFR